MRVLPLIALTLAGSVCGARAAVTQYRVQGTFPDGETLSGSFLLDDAIPLPRSIYGSTLAIGHLGGYPAFAGAHVPVPATSTFLDIEFYGQGILNLQVPADYDLNTGLVQDIRNGSFGTSALYAAGPNDMLLTSGSVSLVVGEPVSMAVLGMGVVLAVSATRRNRG